MRQTVLELSESFRSSNEEERRRLLQEKMDQYLTARWEAHGRNGDKDDVF